MGEFVRGTRVYVGGLSDGVKKEEIEDEFRKFGKLNSVWVAFNPPGFAFVEFQNREDAESACDSLNNSTFLGPKLRVEISRGRGRGGSRGSSRGGGFRGSRGGGGFRGGRGGDSDRSFSRGFGRGSYDRGSFRGGRGSFGSGGFGRREGGSGGRYDDYDSSRPRGGSSYGSSRGASSYPERSSRDDYDRAGYGRDAYNGGSRGGDFRSSRGSGYSGDRSSGGTPGGSSYGLGRESLRENYEANGYSSTRDSTAAGRYRSRSPVGRGSTRDYSDSSYGYGGRSGGNSFERTGSRYSNSAY